MGAPQEFPLRPLGIGEIFDRAVTIYVRHFAVFTVIMLTFLAPLGVVRIFLAGKLGYADALTQLGKPGSVPPPQLSGLFTGLFLIFVLALVLAPIVNNAVAVGVANLYSGQNPTYAQSFRAVFGRLGQLFGAAILFVMILLGIYFATAVVLVIVVAIGAAMVNGLLPLAILFYILAGLGFLAFMLFLLVMIVTGAFALYSTSIEKLGAVDAVTKAFSRIFNRGEFKKAMLVALAFLGLELGIVLVQTGITLLLAYWLKSMAIMIGVETIVSALFSSFVAILLAVYYYDVRTRAEGLDLEVDLARLTA